MELIVSTGFQSSLWKGEENMLILSFLIVKPYFYSKLANYIHS